jgi:hypothetical protein
MFIECEMKWDRCDILLQIQELKNSSVFNIFFQYQSDVFIEGIRNTLMNLTFSHLLCFHDHIK